MDIRLNHACHKALNAFVMSDEFHIEEIKEAVTPYEAAEIVANTLVEKGFAEARPFKQYRITPFGKENYDYFQKEEMRYQKELFEHKMNVVQSWVNTILAVAGFVIAIIALCK